MFIIADNIQPMNPSISRSIKLFDAKPIENIVKKCEEKGVAAIDINPGSFARKGVEVISFLIETVQRITNIRLCIDSNRADVLEHALKLCRRKPIINGFSLEPYKLHNILPLAVEHDTDVIGFLLSPDGNVPSDSNERMEYALKLFDEAQKAGLNPERLIIDPILVPITWEDGTFQAREVLTTLSVLPDLLGFKVRTVVGLSNLTSGCPYPEKKAFLEKIFLAMLSQAGLNMVLMNIMRNDSIRTVRVCNAILGQHVFSWAEV